MRCDFHLHTSKSDGVWPPERLFEEIRQRALEAFSITDHECVEAYPVPDDLQCRVIPGLEADSVHSGQTAHLLAYGVDNADAPLLRALQRQREDRVPRMLAMIERLQSVGIPVTIQDVAAQAPERHRLQRPHLARAMVVKGVVRSVDEAFERYLNDTCYAYVPLERMASAAVIELIHGSGGVAIVAHPMRLLAAQAMTELCELGADGIEVYSPTASPAAQRTLLDFARSRRLLVTGGTDFHAPGAELGVEVDEQDVEELKAAVNRYRASSQNVHEAVTGPHQDRGYERP